mgnify:CR=1 FL=1
MPPLKPGEIASYFKEVSATVGVSGRMWQADFQHTLYLPQPDGRKRKVKLCAILDDYSRYSVHAQFYYEKMPCLEDSLKKAIEKHGLCEQFYCDNGADSILGGIGIKR